MELIDGVKVRQASEVDVEFIFKAIVREAGRGHFNPDYLNPLTHKGLRLQISMTIGKKLCPTHRGTNEKSYLYICTIEERSVGFCWITKQEDGYELLMQAVSEEYRKRGIGKFISESVISKFPSRTKFYARTYLESSVMLKILMSLGFQKTRDQVPGKLKLTMVSS